MHQDTIDTLKQRYSYRDELYGYTIIEDLINDSTVVGYEISVGAENDSGEMVWVRTTPELGSYEVVAYDAEGESIEMSEYDDVVLAFTKFEKMLFDGNR